MFHFFILLIQFSRQYFDRQCESGSKTAKLDIYASKKSSHIILSLHYQGQETETQSEAARDTNDADSITEAADG
jgi:hypothetical protein